MDREGRTDYTDRGGLCSLWGLEVLVEHLGDLEEEGVEVHGGQGRCRDTMLDVRRGPGAKRDDVDDGGVVGGLAAEGALGCDVLGGVGQRIVVPHLTRYHFDLHLKGCGTDVGVAAYCGGCGCGWLASVSVSGQPASVQEIQVLVEAVAGLRDGRSLAVLTLGGR